jgi:hypothetical protein
VALRSTGAVKRARIPPFIPQKRDSPRRRRPLPVRGHVFEQRRMELGEFIQHDMIAVRVSPEQRIIRGTTTW